MICKLKYDNLPAATNNIHSLNTLIERIIIGPTEFPEVILDSLSAKLKSRPSAKCIIPSLHFSNSLH